MFGIKLPVLLRAIPVSQEISAEGQDGLCLRLPGLGHVRLGPRTGHLLVTMVISSVCVVERPACTLQTGRQEGPDSGQSDPSGG